jgi:lipid-binding SYLF domain-containing protein
MGAMRLFLLASVATLALPLHAQESPEEIKLARATEVLERFTRIPEESIPPALLRGAYGVAVIPDVIKAGFFVGGRRGKGILVVRSANGEWSNPAFVTLTGGSLGWQIGGQSTDTVLVFKSSKSVENIAEGKLTLGADAAIAAGPVGRQTAAATDLRLSAEVYSYSRSRGLFAGVALEGAVIGIDEQANRAFYGNKGITSVDVLADQSLATPANARRFILVLEQATPQPAAETPDTELAEEGDPSKTYPLEDFD